jgi:hypothetical protein
VANELMIDRVEEAVAEQPIPRLQTVGNSETAFPFRYDIDWGVALGENELADRM